MSIPQTKAGVLFSGGQDSATVLAWALTRYDHVETIGFDYGQRHDVELEARQDVLARIRADFPEWGQRLGDDHLVDLSGFGAISETALTRDREIDTLESGLPNTFVPGRNLVFLNFAAAVGWRRGFTELVAGMCEADFSGYPDCRQDTLDAQMQAISLGFDTPYRLHTPLMHRSKAGAWELAEELGGKALVELIRTRTHTCYIGQRSELLAWGYGCGHCPACEIRARGWAEYAAA